MCVNTQYHLIHMQNGCSPLYVASEMGHSQIVDVLLLNQADPNLTTKVCGPMWPFTYHRNDKLCLLNPRHMYHRVIVVSSVCLSVCVSLCYH